MEKIEVLSVSPNGDSFQIVFKEGRAMHEVNLCKSYFRIDSAKASKLAFLHWGKNEAPFQKENINGVLTFPRLFQDIQSRI